MHALKPRYALVMRSLPAVALVGCFAALWTACNACHAPTVALGPADGNCHPLIQLPPEGMSTTCSTQAGVAGAVYDEVSTVDSLGSLASQ